MLNQLPFCKREMSIDAQAETNAELIYKIEGHRRENLDPNMKLSRIFSVMNDLKDRVKVVQDYQVTRSSLEHVFIHFAKFQLGTGVPIIPQAGAIIPQT
jgi:UDP-N-acetylglucosamine 2-epimerase